MHLAKAVERAFIPILYQLNTYLSLIRKGFRRNIFLKSIRDIYVSGLKPIFVN